MIGTSRITPSYHIGDAMIDVTVTGDKGSQWTGTACQLPFGRLAQLDDAALTNPNDRSEHAITYETTDIIWDV